MDKRQINPTQQEDVSEPVEDKQQRAVRGGRVDVGGGKRKTLWQLIKAGLVQVDRPPSKHRGFTHTGHTIKRRKRKRHLRQIAKVSRRRNRPSKRCTGVRPVRKRVRV